MKLDGELAVSSILDKYFIVRIAWVFGVNGKNFIKTIQCADKYSVRSYIKSLGEEQILNSIIGVWTNEEDIPWEKLPNQFVLKCNHGCGYNIIVSDKTQLDIESARKKLKKWMEEDYSAYNIEPHYSKIKRRIICETYLGDNVVNYNIYCFNGKPVFFSLASGLGEKKDERLTYYYVNGKKADFKNRSFPTDEVELSPILPEMVKCAERLSKDFPMVRVDLFDINGRIVLSELTFTPGGTFIPIEPYSADCKLGKKLDITSEMKKWRMKNGK